MTETPAIEQMTDEAVIRLIREYRPSMPGDVLHLWASDAVGQMAALLSDRASLAEAGLRLANAADVYGVAYLDSDDMPPEAEELQAATSDVRNLLPAALLPKGERTS